MDAGTLIQTTPNRPTAERPPSGEREHAEPGPRWVERPMGKKAIVSAGIALLLGLGVWTAIGQVASYSRLLDALGRASAEWFVVCAVGAAVGYLGYALMYRAVIAVQRGPRPGLGVTLRLTIAAFAASVLATSAGRVGFEYWSLRRMRDNPDRSSRRVLALNTWEWAVLAAAAWIGAIALAVGAGKGAPLGVEIAWLVALPACLMPAMYLSSPRRRSLAEPRGSRARRAFAAAIGGIVLLRTLLSGGRRDLLRSWGGALLHWGGDFMILWAALRAFGVEIGPAALVVGYATGFAATILPLPVGGAGGVDAAMTFALVLVGVPLGPALLATLVLRAFTYWLPVVVALAGARSLKRLPGELSELGARRGREAAAGPSRLAGAGAG